jgi:hypothetical protein
MKNYFGVVWHTKVKILAGVVNDKEVKFEVKECVKELQVDFIRTK